jgi:hypothetical protein
MSSIKKDPLFSDLDAETPSQEAPRVFSEPPPVVQVATADNLVNREGHRIRKLLRPPN